MIQHIGLLFLLTTKYGKVSKTAVKIMNLHKNINQMLINC